MLEMLLQVAPSPELVDACGANPSWACRRIFDTTGNKGLAGAVDYAIGAPLRILVILVVAWIVNRLIRRAIRRFTDTISGAAVHSGRMQALRDRAPSLLVPSESSVRAASRAQTIGSVLRSLSTAIVYSIAAVTVLGELGINLGPIVASAGIVGVAVGFGAQSLVKDFVSGFFILAEDQYGVGDSITVGVVTGTVEEVNLRVTSIRANDGTLWFVPNGEIRMVGNAAKDWARAVVDIVVPKGADLALAIAAITDEVDTLAADEAWAEALTDKPQVLGVETMGTEGLTVRVEVKTTPGTRARVARELRTRIGARLYREGIASRQDWKVEPPLAPSGSTSPDGAPTAPSPPSAPEPPLPIG